MVSIESNIEEVAARLNTKPADLKRGVQAGLDESARQSVSFMKAKLNLYSKSGKLYRSVDSKKTGEYSRTIGPFMDEQYPIYVEKGRGPVYPVRAKALRIPLESGVIFRKSAGPAKARPFAKPTLEHTTKMFPMVMEKEIKKALK